MTIESPSAADAALQHFLQPDADTPLTDPVKEEGTPLSLDDAFSKLVKEMDSPTPASGGEPAKDTSNPLEDANSQSQQVTDTGTSPQAPQKDDTALRDQLIAEKDAQIRLYTQRLNELSKQYQSLKNVSQQMYGSIQNQRQEEVIPDKVKELQDNYPDLADAMEEYIGWKVGDPVADADRIATQKAALVAQQVQQLQRQQHVNTILAKHPDMHEVIRSQDAKQWFDGLDPIAKRGAQYVINYGTAGDVVSLLDQYKAARGSGTTQHNNSAGINNLANRVASAVGVKSHKAEPIPQQTTPERQMTTKEAFERLAREYEKDPYKVK